MNTRRYPPARRSDRAGWRAAWGEAATSQAQLSKAVCGDDLGQSFRGDDIPKGRLRVVEGCPGVWERPDVSGYVGRERRDPWGRLLLSLPELGTGEDLQLRLARSWEGGLGIVDARTRAADLGLSVTEVSYKVETKVIGEKERMGIEWAARLAGVHGAFASALVFVPGREDDLGDEEIPEVEAAYREWAARLLARESRVKVSGVVSLEKATTKAETYESPDGMGTRMSHPVGFTTIKMDGRKVGSIMACEWAVAVEALGIVDGEAHPGLCGRQFKAFELLADRGSWSFGWLGPRARAALVAAAREDLP